MNRLPTDEFRAHIRRLFDVYDNEQFKIQEPSNGWPTIMYHQFDKADIESPLIAFFLTKGGSIDYRTKTYSVLGWQSAPGSIYQIAKDQLEAACRHKIRQMTARSRMPYVDEVMNVYYDI